MQTTNKLTRSMCHITDPCCMSVRWNIKLTAMVRLFIAHITQKPQISLALGSRPRRDGLLVKFFCTQHSGSNRWATGNKRKRSKIVRKPKMDKRQKVDQSNAGRCMHFAGCNQNLPTYTLLWRSNRETPRKTEGERGKRDVWVQGGEAFSTWDCPRWTISLPL